MQRRSHARAGSRRGVARNTLLVASAIVLAGCIVPVGAATPGATSSATTNVSLSATDTPVRSVNSTLIPLTAVAVPGGETSGPLIVTLQPIHPPTSTPPRPNTGPTASPVPASGTPRNRGPTATRAAASPVRGAVMPAGRSPTVAPARAIIPAAPLVTTPIPTLALPPTAVPTTAGGSDTATATPDQLPMAPSPAPVAATAARAPTPIPDVDTLPTVTRATPDTDMSDAPSPETAPANLPAPLLASGRIGGIVALAVFVLVLGAIGVVGGIVALVRGRRA